jgi:hypothetical protein
VVDALLELLGVDDLAQLVGDLRVAGGEQLVERLLMLKLLPVSEPRGSAGACALGSGAVAAGSAGGGTGAASR